LVSMQTADASDAEIRSFACGHGHVLSCALENHKCHEVLGHFSLPTTYNEFRGLCSRGRHLAAVEDPVLI
jgi:hypothetical protein